MPAKQSIKEKKKVDHENESVKRKRAEEEQEKETQKQKEKKRHQKDEDEEEEEIFPEDRELDSDQEQEPPKKKARKESKEKSKKSPKKQKEEEEEEEEEKNQKPKKKRKEVEAEALQERIKKLQKLRDNEEKEQKAVSKKTNFLKDLKKGDLERMIYMLDCGHAIPYTMFRSMIKSVTKRVEGNEPDEDGLFDDGPIHRYSLEAMDLLKNVTEEVLTDMFAVSNTIAYYNTRHTVNQSDVRLAAAITRMTGVPLNQHCEVKNLIPNQRLLEYKPSFKIQPGVDNGKIEKIILDEGLKKANPRLFQMLEKKLTKMPQVLDLRVGEREVHEDDSSKKKKDKKKQLDETYKQK